MKTQHSMWKKHLTGILVCLFCAALEVHAQRGGGGGGGGFGGFGGGGGGGFNRGGGGGSSANSQYSNNGQVGTATFAVDPATHDIIFTADEETAKQIMEVIANLDRPKPQVLIKVVFLEVQHNDSSDIGLEGGWRAPIGKGGTNGLGLLGTAATIFGLSGQNTVTTNFNALGGVFGPALSPLNAAGSGGAFSILGSDFQATLRAIAKSGKAELLSRPSVLVRDGQPATIHVGQSVPLVTSVSYSGLANTPVNNITYQPVGIQLNVTPFISQNGYVEMIVSPSISSVDPTLSQAISPGVTAPYLNVRSADTVVMTPDGQTVVIGGLMENNKASAESKIPFLGDIPLIGNLFKEKVKTSDKSELLIFLTPHIVLAPTQLAAMSEKEQNQMLPPKSFSEAELDQFLDRVPAVKETPSSRVRKSSK